MLTNNILKVYSATTHQIFSFFFTVVFEISVYFETDANYCLFKNEWLICLKLKEI